MKRQNIARNHFVESPFLVHWLKISFGHNSSKGTDTIHTRTLMAEAAMQGTKLMLIHTHASMAPEELGIEPPTFQ